MAKIKFGVIGLGGIAQIIHLPILLKQRDVEITAICDKEASKVKSLAQKHGVKNFYKDADKLLEENPDISAIIVSTQTDAHKDIVIKCLNAGKNVLVERPIARNVKEAEAIVSAAKKSKGKLMVGMNNRFRHDVMMVKSFIRTNEVGNIFYVKTGWLKSKSSDEKWFTEKEKSGGGVVLDNGIAMLDMGLWLLGFPQVKSVNAVNYYQNTKSVEDSNITLIKFKNGASLRMEVSWSFLTDEFYYCDAFGVEGSSSINPLKIYKNMEGNLFNITPKNVKIPSNLFRNSYELELKHFIKVVKGEVKLISSGEEAVKTMKLIEQIYASAKNGREIISK